MPPRHRRVVHAAEGPGRRPARPAGPDRPRPRPAQRPGHHDHARALVADRARGERGPAMTEAIQIPSATDDPRVYVDALLATLGDRDPLEVLGATPAVVGRVVAGLSGEQWARPLGSGEWSAEQVLGHLFDVDLVYGFRWRLILTEDRPSYPGYDEKRFAALPKPAGPELLAIWERLRVANLALLAGMPRSAWERLGVHSEQGEERFGLTVAKVAGHDLAHLNQLQRTVESARST